MIKHLTFPILLFFCIFFTSCGVDTKQKDIFLDGKWKIYKAERNDKVTKTLEGGFFSFSADTSFTTNIFGNESLFTFEKKGGRLVTKTGTPDLNFDIQSNGVDSLVLEGNIKIFKMALYLTRDSI